MTRVLFAGGGTGGHLYPALAIAHAMKELEPSISPYFIGAQRGIERDILPASGFEFALLDLHPLYRRSLLSNYRTIYGGIGAWRSVSAIVEQARPMALVATGGYAAGISLAYAVRSEIPVFIQEQNAYPGMTVRAFSRFARQLHLGFPEARVHLKTGRHTEVFDSGNPITPPPSAAERAALGRPAAAHEWGFQNPEAPLILVFGGSQGALAINEAIAYVIRSGSASEANILWATGPATFDRFKALESARVKVLPYISDMAKAYSAATFCVGRAGAMTVAEICAWGLPGILVPLPTAAADHQRINALAMARAGAAIVLDQSDSLSTTLVEAVFTLIGNASMLKSMADAALSRARPEAAKDIANKILTVFN